MMYDFTMKCRDKIDSAQVWANPYLDYSKKPRIYTHKVAWQKCLDNANTDKYVDCHCHVFTPYSFLEILKSLKENNLLNFDIVSFTETSENSMEFFVSLKKSKVKSNNRLKNYPNIEPDPSIWEIQEELYSLKKRLSELENSKSWKLTRPLRKLKINKK